MSLRESHDLALVTVENCLITVDKVLFLGIKSNLHDIKHPLVAHIYCLSFLSLPNMESRTIRIFARKLYALDLPHPINIL